LIDLNCPNAGAYGAAIHRAVHQLLDIPLILDDPMALKIIDGIKLSELQANINRYRAEQEQFLRAFIVMRSRYTEDTLAQCVQNGIRQYVILGAGLDTFSYRNLYPQSALDVFEVDQPGMQLWKKQHLIKLGILLPKQLAYVPMNFENNLLRTALQATNFKFDQPAFFSLLGVTQYLSYEAVFEIFKFVSSMPKESEIVFEYILSPLLLNSLQQRDLVQTAKRSAARGEQWRTFFDPLILAENLHRIGFRYTEDIGVEKLNKQYFMNRSDGLHIGGVAHLMMART
jgi:methyltransferase (TIGR00027 family)